MSGKSGAAHGLDERVVSAVLEPMAHGKVNKKASGHPPTLPYPSSRIDSIMLGKRESQGPGVTAFAKRHIIMRAAKETLLQQQ